MVKEKTVQSPADTKGMRRPHSTFLLNFISRQWPSHDVSSHLFHLSCMVLAHMETKLKIPVQNVLLCWWGQSPCKHLLGQFSVSPSPYSCTNTVPCFSCRGIRSAESLTRLRLSPSNTKLKKRCAYKRVLIIKPTHLWFLSLMLCLQDLSAVLAHMISWFPKPASFSFFFFSPEKTSIKRLFSTTQSWQHFTFLIFLVCTNT